MNRARRCMALVMALLLDATLVPRVYARELVVTVDNLWAEKGGTLYVSVYVDEESFESNTNPLVSASLPVSGETLQTVFETEGFEEVAVAVFHDFNGNGDMDNNIIGLPREGFGASRNPDSRVAVRNGPPRYVEARFNPSVLEAVSIPMNYLFR